MNRLASRFTLRHSPSSATGFSLIEIMLAMAIISFALVGIIGLLPAALQAASNSQRETQAALIARSIFADLDSEIGINRQVIVEANDWKSAPEEGQPDSRRRQSVNLTAQSTHYLAYDSNGSVLNDSVGSSDYTSGHGDGAFIAEISVEPLVPSAQTPAGLSTVRVTVGAPAAASLERRASYSFVSVLRQNANAAPVVP